MAKTNLQFSFSRPAARVAPHRRGVAQVRPHGAAAPVGVPQEPHDHFVVKNGIRCAGVHLIVALYDARQLDDVEHIESALRRSVDAAGATLLHVHLHHFEPNGGVSGVAVLAESHISIHAWPERRYAAIDIFMCGKAEPVACVPVLQETFAPRRTDVNEILRGRAA
jgi:S-adenosylmethionine decarboxylase